MAYCKNCGNQLKAGAPFCGECGQVIKKQNEFSEPVIPTPSTNIPPSRENQKEMSPPPRKPLSKKTKVLMTIAVSFAILLIGSYFVVGNMIGPKSVVSDFMDAIESKDAQKLKKFLNEGQLELSVDDKQAKAFIAYLYKDPRRITEISRSLEKNLAVYKTTDSIPAVGESSSFAQLKQDGKRWLLFDRYVVQIQPVYAEIQSSEDETEIYFNDKKVGTVNSEKEKAFGPFLPGVYKIKAVVNGEYGKVEQEEEIDFLDSELSEMSLSFDWSDYYVDVYSYVDDAILYVNGKSTKKNIDDIDSIGPIPMDGSVKLYIEKELTSGVKTSKEVTIEEGMNSVKFDIDDKESEEMEKNESKEKEGSVKSADNEQGETSEIKNVILDHYGNISKDNYSSAYNLFSSTMKNKFALEGWEKGLQANISDKVTNLEVQSVEGNSAKVYLEMTSYDDQGDGTTLVQEWGGYWNLLKENGQWKLNDPELENLGSRTE